MPTLAHFCLRPHSRHSTKAEQWLLPVRSARAGHGALGRLRAEGRRCADAGAASSDRIAPLALIHEFAKPGLLAPSKRPMFGLEPRLKRLAILRMDKLLVSSEEVWTWSDR